ncbi:uncharacterized protein [Coffea arabica]|uniref:RNase H type-1 domain-containing protein n=1 Tax=Coffea arabica TaxID=13443 RepID=A0ABM4U5R0_COFAR
MVVNKAMQEWQEYELVNQKIKEAEQETGPQSQDRWKPPIAGVVIRNTDAATDIKHGKASWGMIARRGYGDIVGAWASIEKRCSDPVVEEACAIRKALTVTMQEGWVNVEIQSDCKIAVSKILDEDTRDAKIETLIEDIKLLKQNFRNCNFSFIRREGNVVSHSLARFALNLVEDVYWKVFFPLKLTRLAREDLGAVAPIL